MAVIVFTVGEVLTSADTNAWFLPREAAKPTTTSITSSVTLVNDPDLVLPVDANAAYEFTCQLFYIATTGSGIQWTWLVPSGAGLLYQSLHNEGGTTGLANSIVGYSQADSVGAVGAGSPVQAARMSGKLAVSAASGTLQLKWAQSVSSGTATQLRADSHLILRRIS